MKLSLLLVVSVCVFFGTGCGITTRVISPFFSAGPPLQRSEYGKVITHDLSHPRLVEFSDLLPTERKEEPEGINLLEVSNDSFLEASVHSGGINDMVINELGSVVFTAGRMVG